MEVLKKGSKGESVKTLQEFLKITVDGDFGTKTENAVKSYQKKNGLIVDGVVGPKTWSHMGILTTDLNENLSVSKGLEIKKYFLPPTEYFAGPTKKEWIFLHHTAGWENPYTVVDVWGRDTRGRIATEFILGGQNVKDGSSKHDGVLVQAFPEGGYGWHTGTGNSPMHRNSVGIEVCNFGYLVNNKTYVGTPAHSSQVVKLAKPFRGYQFWHKYSDEQLNVLKNWIIYIANRDGIDPKVGLVELIKTKGADAFDVCDVKMAESKKGMWSHTNVMRGKVDMFPQQELIDMLLSL